MTHKEVFALMMDELDGVLTAAGRERLEQHLALCADCYAEWEALRLVDNLFASAPTIPAPTGFSQRVQARLEAPSVKRTLGALFALSLGSVAALLVVAVPAAVALLSIWTVYNQPGRFTELLIWLNQLVGVSSSLMGALWTTLRLFFVEVAGDPAILAWTLAAGAAVGLWAHFVRRPAPVRVSNGLVG